MDEKGFVEGMREYIAQLNREKRYSSAKSYQDALNSFIRYSGTDCIAYSAINKDNLRRYEAYLLENGCMRNTISTYMRRLRCIRQVNFKRTTFGFSIIVIPPIYNVIKCFFSIYFY